MVLPRDSTNPLYLRPPRSHPMKDVSILLQRPVDHGTLIPPSSSNGSTSLGNLCFYFLINSFDEENQATTNLIFFFIKDWKSVIPKSRMGWGGKSRKYIHSSSPCSKENQSRGNIKTIVTSLFCHHDHTFQRMVLSFMGKFILLEQTLTTRQSLNKLPSSSYTFTEKRALLHCLHIDTTLLLLRELPNSLFFGISKLQHRYIETFSYDLREMMGFRKF